MLIEIELEGKNYLSLFSQEIGLRGNLDNYCYLVLNNLILFYSKQYNNRVKTLMLTL